MQGGGLFLCFLCGLLLTLDPNPDVLRIPTYRPVKQKPLVKRPLTCARLGGTEKEVGFRV